MRSWNTLLRWRLSLLFVVVVSVLGAGLADWLFYDHGKGGVSYAIFACVLWGGILMRYPRLFKERAGILAVAWSGALAVLPAEEPELLRLVMLVLVLVSLAMIGRCGWRPELGIWALRWFDLMVLGWWRPIMDMRIVRRFRQFKPQAQWLRFILVWLVPVFIASVFVFLFSMANPLIDKFLGDLGVLLQHIMNEIVIPAPLRLLLWLVVGVGVWQLMRIRRRRERAAIELPPPIPSRRPERETGFVVRTLLLCNVVFAIQNVMDSGFLWCGLKLPEGFTYASYAHRGAYPLIATALLAALFILVAFRPHGPGMKNGGARLLVFCWLGQNVFLTVSAIWRLKIYVGAYSLTRLRVAAGVWMIIVAIGLLLIVLRIAAKRSNVWLVRANVMSLLVVLSLCCLANFDGMIANWNVDAELSSSQIVALDLKYLGELGPDSLPALWRLEDSGRYRDAAELAEVIKTLEVELGSMATDWRQWTLRRRHLRRVGVETIH